jgi:hypothetical protein
MRTRHGMLLIIGNMCLALALALAVAGCGDTSSSGDTGSGTGAPPVIGQSPSGSPTTSGSGGGSTGCQVPATPVATPGSGNRYIVSAVTATGVDAQGNPTGVTSHFNAGATVYVVLTVRGVTDGQSHLLSVRWFIQGQDVSLQQHTGSLGEPIPGDGTYAFKATFQTTGVGMVRIYWDLPLNTNTLADTLNFGVGFTC